MNPYYTHYFCINHGVTPGSQPYEDIYYELMLSFGASTEVEESILPFESGRRMGQDDHLMAARDQEQIASRAYDGKRQVFWKTHMIRSIF